MISAIVNSEGSVLAPYVYWRSVTTSPYVTSMYIRPISVILVFQATWLLAKIVHVTLIQPVTLPTPSMFITAFTTTAMKLATLVHSVTKKILEAYLSYQNIEVATISHGSPKSFHQVEKVDTSYGWWLRLQLIWERQVQLHSYRQVYACDLPMCCWHSLCWCNRKLLLRMRPGLNWQ